MRLRKIEENQALAVLSRIMVRVNAQEAIKEESARLLNREMELFEIQHRDDFSMDLVKIYNLYLERLQAEARIAQEQLDAMKPELDQARGVVLERSRHRRVVEILKERYKRQYDDEFRKAERKEIEESNRRPPYQPLYQEITDEAKPGGINKSFTDD